MEVEYTTSNGLISVELMEIMVHFVVLVMHLLCNCCFILYVILCYLLPVFILGAFMVIVLSAVILRL